MDRGNTRRLQKSVRWLFLELGWASLERAKTFQLSTSLQQVKEDGNAYLFCELPSSSVPVILHFCFNLRTELSIFVARLTDPVADMICEECIEYVRALMLSWTTDGASSLPKPGSEAHVPFFDDQTLAANVDHLSEANGISDLDFVAESVRDKEALPQDDCSDAGGTQRNPTNQYISTSFF